MAKYWTDEKIERKLTDVIRKLDVDYLPDKEQLSIVPGLHRAVINNGGMKYWTKKLGLAQNPRKRKEYAIYKGDEFLFIGTAAYCVERLNISMSFFRTMTSASYLNSREGERSIFVVDVGKEGDYPQDKLSKQIG